MGIFSGKRIELSERQVTDLERYLDRHRGDDERDAEDAAGEAVGYLRAAFQRQTDQKRAE